MGLPKVGRCTPGVSLEEAAESGNVAETKLRGGLLRGANRQQLLGPLHQLAANDAFGTNTKLRAAEPKKRNRLHPELVCVEGDGVVGPVVLVDQRK